MNTYIYNQGEPPKNVYVVVDGSFEIIRTTHNRIKTINEVPRNLLQTSAAISPSSSKTGGKIPLRKKILSCDVRIAIVQKGAIFGHDDVVSDRGYTTSVKCVSNNGMLYVISAPVCYVELRKVETCWRGVPALASEHD